MSFQNNIATSDYSSLMTASKKIFKIISERLNVQTAYVTKKGDTAMTVLSSYNGKEEIIPEGYSVEYGGTYCRLIISDQQNRWMTTADLTKDAITSKLEVTSQLKVKGFLGVTLEDLDGNVFGTLCVMDKEEKNFSQKDIEFLRSVADVMSHIIDLDQTKYHMAFLTVPIIPITKGVSILPIQGIIDENRADNITKSVLKYGAEHQIGHFIIDLSGLVILDGIFPHVLTNLVKSLELMGIKTIVTGISPAIAQYDIENGQLYQLKTPVTRNLESALESIGFYLMEKE